ncbi:hypothetical protein ODJ79_27045 [Actinoplanes sp. KI2]|nr:hypothetical protein [Actinoplanes sp. KI2]MCU7727405.1 hypothetical protein [Actinoplanes sp. KI2]
MLARWLLPDRAYDRVLVGLFTALAAASARNAEDSSRASIEDRHKQ